MSLKDCLPLLELDATRSTKTDALLALLLPTRAQTVCPILVCAMLMDLACLREAVLAKCIKSAHHHPARLPLSSFVLRSVSNSRTGVRLEKASMGPCTRLGQNKNECKLPPSPFYKAALRISLPARHRIGKMVRLGGADVDDGPCE